MAVPKGQFEAADALGIPPWRFVRRVLVPQALPVICAPYFTRAIVTVKATSLASIVAVGEITAESMSKITETYRATEFLAVVAIVYLLLSSVLARAAILGPTPREPAMTAPNDTPPAPRFMLEIVALRKSWGDKTVLKGIDLGVPPGQVVSLIGASGSGKSTLLRCVNYLETPDPGSTILVNGQQIGGDDPAPQFRPGAA